MGIGAGWLKMFCGWAADGIIPRNGHILDVGASELFCADDPAVLDHACDAFGAARLSQSEVARMSNRAFAAELFRHLGYSYTAIDYADFPGIVRLDLNHDRLPWRMRQRFNIVLNCGTTEHVMNQWNAFKVIHEACAEGAVMYHGVPAWGDFDHGVISYNPKWFWALAVDNDYEIVKFWGSIDSDVRPIDDDFLKVIRFPSSPQGNKCWLHILLKNRKVKTFCGLNDPAFGAERTSPR